VFLVHPDQSEQVPAMMERYRRMIEAADGVVHREEDWGRRQLTHSIGKVHKAHYLMLNVECSQDTLNELTGAFRFSDAVIRHLVVKRTKAITEPSYMAKAEEEEKAKEGHSEGGRSRGSERSRGSDDRDSDDRNSRDRDSDDRNSGDGDGATDDSATDDSATDDSATDDSATDDADDDGSTTDEDNEDK
jgi:small subunit ribosomal protein S6